MSHVIPDINSGFYSNLDANYLFTMDCTIKTIGQIGNAIFIICSTKFLLNSNSIKSKNIIFIVLNSYFFFWLSFGILKMFNLIEHAEIITFNEPIIRQIFPILTGFNWFILPYLFLYILHPLLNKIVNNYENGDWKIILFIIISFCIVRYIILVYTDNDVLFGDKLSLFVVTYLTIGYVIKFNYTLENKQSIIVLISSFITIFSVSFFIKYTSPDRINRIPIFTTCFGFLPNLLCSYSLFCIFRNMDIKCRYMCCIGKNSLIGYLFINNPFIVAIAHNVIYVQLCQSSFQPEFVMLYWVIGSTIVFILLSPIIIIYNFSLKKVFQFISEKITILIFLCSNKIINHNTLKKNQ